MKPLKAKNAFILNFLKLYNMLWYLALPLLRRNKRLQHGFENRIRTKHLGPADIWIQAASAGEAYLAVKLIKAFKVEKEISILVTSITVQGIEILKAQLNSTCVDPKINLSIEWFPFDIPDVMKQAVRTINPKVMVLLETELWPALLFHLKLNQTQILMVNARMTRRSFNSYWRTRFLWKKLAPDVILATSKQDIKRYSDLFFKSDVKIMPNMKFEETEQSGLNTQKNSEVNHIFSDHLPLSVMASIRKQEEKDTLEMIKYLNRNKPNLVIAIFPRHQHRVKHWKKHLKKLGIKWQLRSNLKGKIEQPSTILWDTFGELQTVYQFAQVVFVGGSLKPLGGQNFIEPALAGAQTIIGPHYDDFNWVGREFFSKGIVSLKNDRHQVVSAMIFSLDNPVSRTSLVSQCKAYISIRQGGTLQACKEILKSL